MKKLFIIFVLLSISAFSNKSDKLPVPDSVKVKTTPLQDSLYKSALQDNLPNSVRIRESLEILEFNMKIRRVINRNPWLAAKKNLQEIPDSYFAADPNEKVIRDMVIRESQFIPGINQFKDGGIQVALSDLATVLGIKEDTSPKISYKVDYPADVVINIYSVSAVIIAVVFDGFQSPGTYTRTWNGKDINGKKLPADDYIAEVIIGDQRSVTKIIRLK